MAGAIRQPIDVDALSRYIESHVPIIKLPIDIKQFGFGQSNPTYQLTAADSTKYVLRKKPPGKLLSKTAHQVEREYKIIHALEKTDVPVPKTYALCTDGNVIGTSFYIMEFLDGRIIEDASMPGVSPQERNALWQEAILTLAKFHRVNPHAVGLDDYGKPSGFYNRQIKTLGTISIAQSQARDIETNQLVGNIPHFENVVEFFSNQALQPQDRSTLVHGDYKIDNVVFHKTEPRVIGILDWEMSTIGHPLSDLANLLSPYTFGRTEEIRSAFPGATNLKAFSPDARLEGIPTYQQCIQWYNEVAGWDAQRDINWGAAFGAYRNSVIMQGIAARYALRQASSAQAKDYGSKMEPFGQLGWQLVQEVKVERGGNVQSKL
ncbi:MAG: hypothetical protein GOMPHAMPRED_007022 [Gomphillus americanus]|uniref:Aminoglycoside phosphotransferase domain-containing protein n=1 Tax=Gomphillus americanus TaxID=1940652 RepID=A0A8H3ETT2_9LECA|nr:MAG: hypothetical protein GOMPHAMPRED_007022 [Gomphillus americanus]